MTRQLTSWMLMVVLLACPQLCRAELVCRDAHGVSQRPVCCECCALEDQATSDQEVPTPEDSRDSCVSCCLCKGAILTQPELEMVPDVEFVIDTLVTIAVDNARESADFLRTTRDLCGGCAADARIALCSLLC